MPLLLLTYSATATAWVRQVATGGGGSLDRGGGDGEAIGETNIYICAYTYFPNRESTTRGGTG